MNLKTLAVAAVAAAGIAFGAGAADAKTRVKIGVDLGGGGCPPPYFDCYEADDGIWYGYVGDEEWPRRRGYDDDYGYGDDDDFGRVSCRQARRMLRYRGWRRVRAEDCSGRRYTFIGWRRGDFYSIRVSARSGRVISVSPY
jgi:hypothetical protein